MVYYCWVMEMAGKYKITAEQKAEIEQARRKNKDKRVENKLKALSMRGDGARAKKISEATGYHPAYVSRLVSKYIHGGLEAITGNHYGGNRRNMSFEEEQEFLRPYIERAAQGQMLDTAEIEIAYEKAVGHHISSGQIYRVLWRHGWRKVMPRSRHPKKAGEEVIAASKKLKKKQENCRRKFTISMETVEKCA